MAHIQLKQMKYFASVSTRFGVLNEVTYVSPDLLKYPFVIETLAAPAGFDAERLVEVADAGTLVAGTYAYNPLDVLRDDVANFGDVLPGDTVVINNPPSEWMLAPGCEFQILNVLSAHTLQIQDAQGRPFVWATKPPIAAGGGLHYQINRRSIPQLEGADGWTQRRDPEQTRFLDSKYLAYYPTSGDAFNHILATQSLVRSLADSMAIDGNGFLQYAPGNPIVNDYEA